MVVIPTEEEMAEISMRGQAVYEAKKPLPEPEFSDQYAMIYVDTSEHVIGKTFNSAHREMLKNRPVDGRLNGQQIGDEVEYGLATWILMGEMMAGRTK